MIGYDELDDELEQGIATGGDGDGGAAPLYEHFRVEVDRGQAPVRVDRFLAEKLQHSSRNRIHKAAEAGFIHGGGRPVKSNY